MESIKKNLFLIILLLTISIVLSAKSASAFFLKSPENAISFEQEEEQEEHEENFRRCSFLIECQISIDGKQRCYKAEKCCEKRTLDCENRYKIIQTCIGKRCSLKRVVDISQDRCQWHH